MKFIRRSIGSFFMAQMGSMVSNKYLENRITAEEMADLKVEALAVPKEKRLQHFFMGSHYSSLFGSQQSGYHHFYSIGPEEQHCTCGLTVPKHQTIENSRGHLNLPSFQGVTLTFINYCKFKAKLQVYVYGAYCQGCEESSATDIAREEVNLWIKNHEGCHIVEVISEP